MHTKGKDSLRLMAKGKGERERLKKEDEERHH